MSLAVVIPTKSRTTCSQAELRRFVLETGRTFGILQCDPEPALRNIVEAVTGEVGGLPCTTHQRVPLCKIKALRLELLVRYNVELAVHSALFTWLVRHARWPVNRHLQKVSLWRDSTVSA